MSESPSRSGAEVVRDPRTSVEELLALDVTEYATLEALVEGPTTASRTAEILAKTIRLVLDGESVRLSLQDGRFDPSSSGTTRSAVTAKLLQRSELTKEQVEKLAAYTSLSEEGGAGLAEHPNAGPEALAAYIAAQQHESLVDHRLHNRGRLAGLEKLTRRDLPEKLRLAAELGMLHNARRNARGDEILSSLTRLWDTPHAAETLAGMRPEWHGRAHELVKLVEGLAELSRP